MAPAPRGGGDRLAAARGRTTRFVATARERLTARAVAGGLAALAGLLVFAVAHEVFPYHSYNHDEAVYLQQAAMLLDGRLVVEPPVQKVFRPWFFVADGGNLYPKYAPVPAAMFAVGSLLGGARIALGLIAAAVVALTYATVAEAFDRRTGLVAAALLLATPLFLIQASVFLPYVPTLAWLLVFAWAYLRADRTGSRRWAALAGLGAGLAFFARPYTAVLFAAPFVAHALWTIVREGRPAATKQGTTAAVALLGVAAALGYNALLTGSPLIFPYEAFAPLDGPGFGWRSLWGHGLEYTPALALESARVALAAYVFRWSVAAPLGVALAVVGLGLVFRRGREVDPRRLVLAGLVVTIPVGQLYFWGTLNAIGSLERPGFGLMGHLGPYYHLVLVLPTAAFAAHALVVAADRLRPRLAAVEGRHARAGLAAVAVVLALAAGAATVAAVADPVADNRAVTDAYARAYAPIEDASLDGAIVFLPTPHGPWLAHPFQYLHNDPGFDGPVVYAQDRRVFDVLDAFPERTPYRYSYRGEWVPVGGRPVDPRLERLAVANDTAVRLDVEAGMPRTTAVVVVQADTEAGEPAATSVVPREDELALTIGLHDDRATVSGPRLAESLAVPIDGRDELTLTLFVDAGGLDSFEYRLEFPVDAGNGTVRAVTPRTFVCRNVEQCDDGGGYVPGAHPAGVSIATNLSAESTAGQSVD